MTWRAPVIFTTSCHIETGNPLHTQNYQQWSASSSGTSGNKLITRKSGRAGGGSGSHRASVHQHYTDEVSLAVRLRLTDAELSFRTTCPPRHWARWSLHCAGAPGSSHQSAVWRRCTPAPAASPRLHCAAALCRASNPKRSIPKKLRNTGTGRALRGTYFDSRAPRIHRRCPHFSRCCSTNSCAFKCTRLRVTSQKLACLSL